MIFRAEVLFFPDLMGGKRYFMDDELAAPLAGFGLGKAAFTIVGGRAIFHWYFR
jgi:hypothetical protein